MRAFFIGRLSRLSGYDLYGSSDFKLLDRKVIDAWLDMRERNTFFRGMITWLGYRQKQISFSVPSRPLDAIALVFFWSFSVSGCCHYSVSRRSLCKQLLFWEGSFCFVPFCSQATRSFCISLGSPVPGFTTVIILEMLIGGVLMISLGIIGTYIAQIYQEVKYRPRYVVARNFTGPQ